MKVFGREPAALVGVVEAALALLVVFGLGLTEDVALGIVAVVQAALGVYLAYVTKDTLLGVAVGLAKACLTLAVLLGLSLTTAQSAAVVAFVAVLVGFFQRTQTYPLAHPSFRDEPVSAPGDHGGVRALGARRDRVSGADSGASSQALHDDVVGLRRGAKDHGSYGEDAPVLTDPKLPNSR